MNIVNKAINFAYQAHDGQVRKSEKDKPYIIHPISVSKILEEYGFDENVQAAGALHDVVEDTKYTLEDIEKEFGLDIASLVNGASEEDKSLSWEERKQHTINSIKELDLRHKAVICADKINNLEDMFLLFEKKGEHDFSAFKRGEDKQKWYHENVYQSLIYNEDPNLEIFKRYRKAINNVFYYEDDLFLKNEIFDDNSDRYDKLKKLHAKKQELIILKKILTIKKPYIIEFSGTPRTGKTTTINNLYDFFKKGGFKVEIVEEFTTSKYYKTILKEELSQFNVGYRNLKIMEYVYDQLFNISMTDNDVVLIDRSLNDRQVWNYLRNKTKDIEDSVYQEYKDKYKDISRDLIDYLIITYADPKVSLKRDYLANLALEQRNFLNLENITKFNNALQDIKPLLEECVDGVTYIDTTNTNLSDIAINACDDVLNDMRKTYIKDIQKQYK